MNNEHTREYLVGLMAQRLRLPLSQPRVWWLVWPDGQTSTIADHRHIPYTAKIKAVVTSPEAAQAVVRLMKGTP